jgi:hypothetical protein
MSLKTLVESVVKTSTASEARPPEKILPAKAALAKVWADFQRAATDLQEAQGHLARVEADEQAALNDETLSVAESSDKVAFCQRSKGIYSARLANREAAKGKLLTDLKGAITAAHAEFSNLIRVEHSRRHDALARRIVVAGHLMEDSFLARPMSSEI